MAFFTEAAVLSAAWANHEELQGLGAKQSLCVIRAKKLSRGYLQAHGMNTIDSALHVSHPCMHACMSEYMEWGDVARNKEAVALAIKHLGMRPSLGMVEQAVYQFFSLCIPRGKEVCSSLALKIFGFHTCIHYHAIWCYHVMHGFFCSEVSSTRCSPGSSSNWCSNSHALQRCMALNLHAWVYESWNHALHAQKHHDATS